jgi:DNA polymerase-3 subunit epsilon
LPVTPRADARACLLKDLGACVAPCVTGPNEEYQAVIDAARVALSADPSPVVAAIAHAVAHHAQIQDYERAGALRDGLSALVDGASRGQRLQALRECRIVAVQPSADGGELVSVAYGEFAGSARAALGGVWESARTLREGWPLAPQAVAGVEEREMLARWLETPGTRLLFMDGTWASPYGGAGRHSQWVTARAQDQSMVADLTRGPRRP